MTIYLSWKIMSKLLPVRKCDDIVGHSYHTHSRTITKDGKPTIWTFACPGGGYNTTPKYLGGN